MNYSTYLADAHGPAQRAADEYRLPQTVFYHPDWGFANTAPLSKILSDKKTEQYVSWLPSNYWN